MVPRTNIALSSDAFQHGGNIPGEYTCDGQDVSPALSWENVPARTLSIAIIMDDPDASGGTFVHWVIFNIPAEKKKLPKGVPEQRLLGDESVQGITDFGRTGYGGPCPPKGKPHRYFFRIYALDTKMELSGNVSRAALENAMKGHILAKGELVGLYGR